MRSRRTSRRERIAVGVLAAALLAAGLLWLLVVWFLDVAGDGGAPWLIGSERTLNRALGIPGSLAALGAGASAIASAITGRTPYVLILLAGIAIAAVLLLVYTTFGYLR